MVAMGPTLPKRVKELLAHRRRRYLLYCLYLYSNPLKLADIADQLTIWGNDGPGDEYLRNRLRIYNSLYHDHLPAMQDADIVNYHQDDDMVDLGPAGKQLEPVIKEKWSAEATELLQAEAEPVDDSG